MQLASRDPLLDARGIARYLSLFTSKGEPDHKAVYRLVSLGILPARRMGGRLRFDVDEVRAALEQVET